MRWDALRRRLPSPSMEEGQDGGAAGWRVLLPTGLFSHPGQGLRHGRTRQPILAQAVAQAATTHPQQARRLGEIAPALTQRLSEALRLVLGHVRSRGERRVDRDGRSRRRQTAPRQALGIDHRRRLEQDHPLQQMAQFPHIARPVIGEQPGLGGLTQPLEADPIGDAVLLQEGARQPQDILAPFAEGWQFQHHHRQPVVQVGAKVPGLDLFAELDLGGGHHFHIQGVLDHRPDPPHAFGLDRGQALALQREGEGGDLIQEQRPS